MRFETLCRAFGRLRVDHTLIIDVDTETGDETLRAIEWGEDVPMAKRPLILRALK
jgi:hypothetical protein